MFVRRVGEEAKAKHVQKKYRRHPDVSSQFPTMFSLSAVLSRLPPSPYLARSGLAAPCAVDLSGNRTRVHIFVSRVFVSTGRELDDGVFERSQIGRRILAEESHGAKKSPRNRASQKTGGN